MQFRLLNVYTRRLADVVLSPREFNIDIPADNTNVIKGDIEIRNLSFRYSSSQPLLFQNVNARIKAGDFVAIIGPSGAGKSTLLKLMCGLYSPTSGEILIDGRTLSAWGPRSVRQSIGVVLQDDELFPGSIIDNVASFNRSIDMDRFWNCLRITALDEDVRGLPLAERSLIGEMGDNLSSGQRQRLLLARALYRKPRILILDEATANLPDVLEQRIGIALASLSITRIVVAHHRETIGRADRVFGLKGSLQELNVNRKPGAGEMPPPLG